MSDRPAENSSESAPDVTAPVSLDCVAIVGVGLIGGSIGLALKARGLARRVIGVGRRAVSLEKALRYETVDETTTDLAEAADRSDLIVVCTPVRTIVPLSRQAAEAARAGTIITDAGSTKASIVRELVGRLSNGVEFVGSHPLAGSDKTGCEEARADLYHDRVVVVTPGRENTTSSVEIVERFWQGLGARIVRLSPERHDAALAVTSHLPHLVASALAAVTPEDLLPLTAGGWADTTRIAGADPELWQQILLDNRDHVLQTLDFFAKVLSSYRAALTENDPAALTQLLELGKQHRDALGNRHLSGPGTTRPQGG